MTKEMYKPPMKNGASIPYEVDVLDTPEPVLRTRRTVEPTKYEFKIPAALVHKSSSVQAELRRLIDRYFKVCLGRCKWTDNFTFICTAEQYLNFTIAAMQVLPQADPGMAIQWVGDITVHMPDEVNAADDVINVFETGTKHWKLPRPNVEFVELDITQSMLVNAEMRDCLSRSFCIVIGDKSKGFTIRARTSQFARYVVALNYMCYSIQPSEPRLINAREYCEAREKTRREGLMVFDVACDDRDIIMKRNEKEQS